MKTKLGQPLGITSHLRIIRQMLHILLNSQKTWMLQCYCYFQMLIEAVKQTIVLLQISKVSCDDSQMLR